MIRLGEILDEISTVNHVNELDKVLRSIEGQYGLKTLAYLGTGALDASLPRREPFLAVTYRPEWVARYKACDYLKIDPVIATGLKRVLPTDWVEFDQHSAQLRQFFGEAAEHGLGRKGMSFPVHGPSGDSGLVSLTADAEGRHWDQLRQIAGHEFPAIATHLHAAVLRSGGIVRPRLSPREIECLFWVAEGKTVWECAVILGITRATARTYLETARAKLGATSNTHAVSIATKLGLLSPFS